MWIGWRITGGRIRIQEIKRIRWERRKRISLDCMICTEMYGNGVKMYGMKIILVRRWMGVRGWLGEILIDISFAGVLGSTLISTCVVPPVLGAILRIGTTTGVFVFPGCKSLPFALLKLTLDSPVRGRDIFCLNQNLQNLKIFRMTPNDYQNAAMMPLTLFCKF